MRDPGSFIPEGSRAYVIASVTNVPRSIELVEELEHELRKLRLAIAAILRSCPEGKLELKPAALIMASTNDTIVEHYDPASQTITLEVR